MQVKEIVYYIMDACKLISDDSVLNEGHVLFLLKKYRSFLIKRERDKDKASIDEASEFETQQICLDLEKVAAIDGEPCTGGYYLRTTKKIPKVLEGSAPRVYPFDYFQGARIAFVPRERMRYVGTNPFLQSIIWVALGPDMRLYFWSGNPQFMYLKKARMSAVFEDFDEAAGLLCDDSGGDSSCDPLEADFPIRDYLVPELIAMCEKEVLGDAYRPKEIENNAKDDLSDMASYIRANMKSNMQKQMDDGE